MHPEGTRKGSQNSRATGSSTCPHGGPDAAEHQAVNLWVGKERAMSAYSVCRRALLGRCGLRMYLNAGGDGVQTFLGARSGANDKEQQALLREQLSSECHHCHQCLPLASQWRHTGPAHQGSMALHLRPEQQRRIKRKRMLSPSMAVYCHAFQSVQCPWMLWTPNEKSTGGVAVESGLDISGWRVGVWEHLWGSCIC